MRRSICLCEPTTALAGEVGTWKFSYTPSVDLPKGTLLKFDLQSAGRPIDWEIPANGSVVASIEKGKTISPTLIETGNKIVPQYEFRLPAELPAGKSFTISLGEPKGKQAGNSAQTFVQRRRPFLLYVDPSGKGHYQEPEMFTMDVRGNKLHTVKILAPSLVGRNRRFDITVRFEDQYGNLTANTDSEALIELTYENLRDSLNWKLFIPETGFITLPNLYFNEEGVYTIRLKNLGNKQEFCSPPIRCFADTEVSLYWGLLHGESDRIDSTDNIESCLRHFRDDKALNFFAASPFESAEETPNDIWKLISQNIADFDEEERFATMLGCQWAGEPGEEGIRQFVFAKDTKPILRKKDAKYTSLKKIYRQFSPGEMVAIPCFTMGKGYHYDFKEWDPNFERVAEIYNAWGSSECLEKQGNTLPIASEGKKGIKETAEGSILQALLKNVRIGFVAGGLDDRGLYGELFESDQLQYPAGLTAIIAETQSRESLVKALFDRRCYATTGERIILGMTLAGFQMGSEVSTEAKPGLAINRHLSGYVAGTTKIEKVEIVRNGEAIKTFKPEGYHFDFEYDDMEPLDKVVLKGSGEQPSFAFYYLRVTQKDGHMAWSSPIWVDHHPKEKAPKKKASKG